MTDKLRVLIVDDSLPLRIVLRSMLTSEGYDVVGELGSGERLRDEIVRLKPHIICLDYILPGVDGLSLLRSIHAAYPQIAVIMMTASDNPKLEQEASEAGTAGFLHKPFSQEQIKNVLRQVAHAQRLLIVAARKKNPFEGKPRRATAVVADDSETIRMLLVAVLAHMGVEVVGQAHDGMEAIKLVAEHKPDFTCLDYEMPVMNGLDALKAIRSAQPDARVLMITSIASPAVVGQVASAGAKGYILKPFHPDKVTQAISQMLAG